VEHHTKLNCNVTFYVQLRANFETLECIRGFVWFVSYMNVNVITRVIIIIIINGEEEEEE
jgi:hypothetical protein